MPKAKKVGIEDRVSVIIPQTPFWKDETARRCLCALDVEKLMEWWPGKPHSPHRDPSKVRSIQRSLDWKRVAQIAAYLLQRDIEDVPRYIKRYFTEIYDPKKLEPGREWPARVAQTASFTRSVLPDFSSILVHVNGAKLDESGRVETGGDRIGRLWINSQSKELKFTVIDGQHRINGAYLALKIKQEGTPSSAMELPAMVYLDLDRTGEPPRKQAQIFIDVNFYQKKVDRSLVMDLFPTARGRDAIDKKERAQDIGRKLMLETGPLVGMVQIPGIQFGVKNVVALSTLVGAIEDLLEGLEAVGLDNLLDQTEFLAMVLKSWLQATGREEKERVLKEKSLSPENVAYQSRVLVAVLTLVPAMIVQLKKSGETFPSDAARPALIMWLRGVIKRAKLMRNGKFIDKEEFKKKRFLGSGGRARFRDLLWVATDNGFNRGRLSDEEMERRAEDVRDETKKALLKYATKKR